MTHAPNYKHVAVIDVGKTNAKLALVDTETMTEIAVRTRPNTVLPAPPYPHFDLEGHWDFFLDTLSELHVAHGIDAISVTTHGAAIVLLDEAGSLAAPMLDYEHTGPDALAAAYDAIRPAFEETGSPRLAAGLNIGAQLHWLFAQDPTLCDRTARIVTYPQYWGFRLTGNSATDVTSLGCHSDLWNPFDNRPSSLVKRLGIEDKLAPAQRPDDVLGALSAQVAAQTGLPDTTPVMCGIHDSNASLVPYLRTGDMPRGDLPKTVVSTGTWVICMALNGTTGGLNPALDTLVNVNALGDPVQTARFMGGREYELLMSGKPTEASQDDRDAVLAKGIMLLPAVVNDSGPFPGRQAKWTMQPETAGQYAFAVSLYLALMTQHCLGLIDARDPVVVEGPFAKNTDYVQILAGLRGANIQISASATGTAIGAAMLVSGRRNPTLQTVAPQYDASTLAAYAARWTSSGRA